jgi:predicted GH43/DUF377 family glycosyl hydrolase
MFGRRRKLKDWVRRDVRNPIIKPTDVIPTREDMEIIGAFNAAAFEYKGRIGLLLRIAERPIQHPDMVLVPLVDPETGKYIIKRFERTSPQINLTNPRAVIYRGKLFLSSVSHLRLAWSDDGVHFEIDNEATIWPEGEYENYGIEDPRVTYIGNRYYICYSAVSPHEVAVRLMWTRDWKTFVREELILHPFNKDVCLLPSEQRGDYWMLHRPSGVIWATNWMWISHSKDLLYWGKPTCLARTRPGKFESGRIGAGAPPVLTDKGYLEIYHGATQDYRYCLGAMLLDRDNPRKIIAQSEGPLMEPLASYEKRGFFGNVVFTDGVLLRDNELWIYYGASDALTCLARVRLKKVWRHLGV